MAKIDSFGSYSSSSNSDDDKTNDIGEIKRPELGYTTKIDKTLFDSGFDSILKEINSLSGEENNNESSLNKFQGDEKKERITALNVHTTINLPKIDESLNALEEQTSRPLFVPDTSNTLKKDSLEIDKFLEELRQPVAPAPEPVAPAPEPVAPAPEPVAPAPEPVAPAPEPVAPAPEPVAPAPEPVAPAPEPVAPAPEPKQKKKSKKKVFATVSILVIALLAITFVLVVLPLVNNNNTATKQPEPVAPAPEPEITQKQPEPTESQTTPPQTVPSTPTSPEENKPNELVIPKELKNKEFIEYNISTFCIELYNADATHHQLTCNTANGRKDFKTPLGIYSVMLKQDQACLNNYFDANQTCGIHYIITFTGWQHTFSENFPAFQPKTQTTYGGVEMPASDAEQLYKFAQVGMPVWIH